MSERTLTWLALVVGVVLGFRAGILTKADRALAARRLERQIMQLFSLTHRRARIQRDRLRQAHQEEFTEGAGE
jgi:hypothetical protein